jgi:hypothetical protein
MNHSPPDAEARVCQSCGKSPGNGIHCGSCGANLIWRRRLPTLGEWKRRSAGGRGESEAGGALRYTPQELDQLQVGPRQAKKGRLTLILTLNEILDADESLEHVANAKGKPGVNFWCALTSTRLLCIPDRAVAFSDRSRLRTFDLAEIHDVGDRRYPVERSYLSFRDADDDRVRFRLQGKDTAATLAACLAGTETA